jgi:hypothetical protein
VGFPTAFFYCILVIPFMDAFLNQYHTQVSPNAPCVTLNAKNQSARLTYTCDFIFRQVLRLNFQVVTDLQAFKAAEGIKIDLTHVTETSAMSIPINGFIAEENLSSAAFTLLPHNETFVLARQLSPNTEWEVLDVFSAVFYFISRHEEWTNDKTDIHDRFDAQASLLVKHNCHLFPLVDSWIDALKANIRKAFPGIALPPVFFKVISTIDVDNVMAYQGKPLVRSLGGLGKSFVRFDFTDIRRRLSCLLTGKKDPFDIYDEVSAFCAEHEIPLAYFFLCRTGTTYDRSLNPHAKVLSKVFAEIKHHRGGIGLHPSYNSAYEFGLLKQEKEILQRRSGNNILYSRQHFLRFDIKSTPQLLQDNGIVADFSMGFAAEPGFRAGTSHPFKFFDFQANKPGNILLVPFCAMDGAYTHYKPVAATEAYGSLVALAESIKKVGGYFTFVYHERTFDNHLYKDYGDLYKKLLLHLK